MTAAVTIEHTAPPLLLSPVSPSSLIVGHARPHSHAPSARLARAQRLAVLEVAVLLTPSNRRPSLEPINHEICSPVPLPIATPLAPSAVSHRDPLLSPAAIESIKPHSLARPTQRSTPKAPIAVLPRTAKNPLPATTATPVITNTVRFALARPNGATDKLPSNHRNPHLRSKVARKEFMVPTHQSASMVTKSGLRIRDRKGQTHEMDQMREEMDARLTNTYSRFLRAAESRTTAFTSTGSGRHKWRHPMVPAGSAIKPRQTQQKHLANNTSIKRDASSDKKKSTRDPTSALLSPLIEFLAKKTMGPPLKPAFQKGHSITKGSDNNKKPMRTTQPYDTDEYRKAYSPSLTFNDAALKKDRLLELIPEALVAQMTTLVASRIDPLFANAQRQLNMTAENMETQIKDTLMDLYGSAAAATASAAPTPLDDLPNVVLGPTEPAKKDMNNDLNPNNGQWVLKEPTCPALPISAVSPMPLDKVYSHIQNELEPQKTHTCDALTQINDTHHTTLVESTALPSVHRHDTLEVLPVPTGEESDSALIFSTETKCPVYNEPDVIFISKSTDPGIPNEPETIVIEHPSLFEIEKRLVLQNKARKQTQELSCADDPGIEDGLQTLFLPQSFIERIELARSKRMQHISAYMGCAVTSSVKEGRSVQGPWDAIESIASEFVGDLFRTLFDELTEFGDMYIDRLVRDELGDALGERPATATHIV
ncbi:hypothetical protein BASA50_002889 [Batrachochytrium salamandrivorans]|uniref:Uncharacterized protein n=1 Tax=Batrachochytrium salamandrivorans TaxID=1357716 RepID=A0ABQ8FJT6_9FUNG|nr:hypothetical protein BASA50_002889 [Batrachochytrium salamandrivorans]